MYLLAVVADLDKSSQSVLADIENSFHFNSPFIHPHFGPFLQISLYLQSMVGKASFAVDTPQSPVQGHFVCLTQIISALF